MKKLGLILFVLGLILAIGAGLSWSGDRDVYADTIKFVGGTTYNLAGSGVTNSATTITLVSFTIPQSGQRLTMNDFGDVLYGTIEPGSKTKQEFVACTGITQNANLTATLTGCSRGMSPIDPYTASTTLRFAHAGASTFIISNPPQLYSEAAFKDNDETITGAWLFSTTSGALPGYISQPDNLSGSTTAFASVGYVNSLANQGAATSTESNGGLVELATALQAASSTDLGADIPLVLQAKNATDTPQSGCATGYGSVAGAGCAIIASLTGIIKQAWIGLSQAFTWTGQHTWTATSTHQGYVQQDTDYGSWGGGYLPTGTIISYASSTAPTGFLSCDGSAVSRSTYGMLFAVIGTTYGVGDGSTTFNVPDARGRNILHASSTANMAQSGGESNHTMTTSELVAHAHTIPDDTSPSEGGTVMTQSGDLTPETTVNSGSTGSTVPFNVLDPYLVAYCIIKI